MCALSTVVADVKKANVCCKSNSFTAATMADTSDIDLIQPDHPQAVDGLIAPPARKRGRVAHRSLHGSTRVALVVGDGSHVHRRHRPFVKAQRSVAGLPHAEADVFSALGLGAVQWHLRYPGLVPNKKS